MIFCIVNPIMEINNFYTMTVYEKGAEVVRMICTLLGKEGFRRGTDLYFSRYDGQAVTCDDFVTAMEEANSKDLEQFKRWYSQSGTPELRISGKHDPKAKKYTLFLGILVAVATGITAGAAAAAGTAATVAAVGTASTGTAIACINGNIRYPGMYEVPMGMTIRDVLEKIGGGVSEGERIKVLQAGGPLNGLLGEDAFDTIIDFAAMSEAGASIGSGGIIVGNETTNVVDLLRSLIAFNQFESCGKCFPCRLGNTHMLEVLDRMCQNKAKSSDLVLLERVGMSMKTGSLCGHGQLGFNPIASALKYFGEEIQSSISGDLETGGVFGDGTMIMPTRTRP